MILVRLLGGLGNQMFQYAFARNLSLKKRVPLKIDTTIYQRDKLRVYSLHPFKIQEKLASPREIFLYQRGNRLFFHLLRFLESFRAPWNRKYVKERRPFVYEPEYFEVGNHVCLDGYWQNEKYFKDNEAVIRREFNFKKPPDSLNEPYAKRISGTNSVSLHIRRGDYIANPVTNKAHGVCSPEYYRRAVDLIGVKIPNPSFFLFSDDPSWVKENFKIPFPSEVISHNSADKDYEDLRLLSLCKHHITANSSFSWWGAWLCSNPEKVVIAPKNWIASSSFDSSDVTPKGWLRL